MKNLLVLTVFIILSMQAHEIGARKPYEGISRTILSSTLLQDIPGYSLTTLTVELQPGVTVPAHKHAGLLFVYVISGTVLSQINRQPVVVYRAGDSWIENLSDQYNVTKNMSDSDNVKILAVFVANKGVKLTVPHAN